MSLPRTTLFGALVCLTACGPTDPQNAGGAGGAGGASCAPLVPDDYPAVTDPCTLEVDAPKRLVVTTTDFVTGSVSIVDLDTGAVSNDVALGHTDAVPVYHGGQLYVLHRFGGNVVEQLHSDTFASTGSFDITAPGTSNPNPQGLAFDTNGLGYLTLYDHATVQVHDFTQAPGHTLQQSVDLSAFADSDGKPEASVVFSCGSVVFVAIQRLANFTPVDCDYLVPISSGTAASTAIPLLGTWAKQVRLDPADATGRTVLVLTSGIERVDLTTGESTWAVPDTLLAGEGIESHNLAAFDITADGAAAYFTATNADFSETHLWRVMLEPPHTPEIVISGLTVVERTLEIVGDTLWVGDRSPATEGIRRWDLSQDPPAEIGAAVNLGLAPYSMTVLP